MIVLDSRACERIAYQAGTPCFVLFPQTLQRLAKLLTPRTRRGIDHIHLAYPIKAMPVASLLRSWKSVGHYVEASSRGECELALRSGYGPRRIILSGPAKHMWLSAERRKDFNVIFDSLSELAALEGQAQRLRWRVGLRFAPEWQVDPDDTSRVDQFGFDERAFDEALSALERTGLRLAVVHFHLGGWSGDGGDRSRTVRRLAEIVKGRANPKVVNIGGGFSQALGSDEVMETVRRARARVREVTSEVHRRFPECREIIVEPGRVILGPSAVLLLRVVDIKIKYGRRFVICDGGRVNHAMPSDWENHELTFPCSPSDTQAAPATVCGPTCMAWDFLTRGLVPEDISPGQFVIYGGAGAYHWSWQTSFSHGRAAAVCATTVGAQHLRIRQLVARQSLQEWAALAGS